MKKLFSASLGLLVAFSLHSYAQNASGSPPASQSTPVDGGAIIMPPVKSQENTTQDFGQADSNASNRQSVGEPPHHHGVPPDKAAKHGQQQTEPASRKSLKDSCKGRPELCKQDSAR